MTKKYNEKRKEHAKQVGYSPAHRAAYVDQRKRDPRISLLRGAKARAKKCGAPFELSLEDINIPDVCPILGLALEPRINEPGVYKSNPNSPSLDRLNPSLGYIKGNVSVISNLANVIKNSGTAEDHRKIAEWMEKMNVQP